MLEYMYVVFEPKTMIFLKSIPALKTHNIGIHMKQNDLHVV